MGVISSIGDAPGHPVIDRETCTNCGACARICPVEERSETPHGIAIDNTNAFGYIACGQCMMVCPLERIAVTGRRASPRDIGPPLPCIPLCRRRRRLYRLHLRYARRRIPRPGDLHDRLRRACSWAQEGAHDVVRPPRGKHAEDRADPGLSRKPPSPGNQKVFPVGTILEREALMFLHVSLNGAAIHVR